MKAPRPLRARTIRRQEAYRKMKENWAKIVAKFNKAFKPQSFDHAAERRSKKHRAVAEA